MREGVALVTKMERWEMRLRVKEGYKGNTNNYKGQRIEKGRTANDSGEHYVIAEHLT